MHFSRIQDFLIFDLLFYETDSPNRMIVLKTLLKTQSQ